MFSWLIRRYLVGSNDVIHIWRMPEVRTIRAHQLGLTSAFFSATAFLFFHYLFAAQVIAWYELLVGILILLLGSYLGLLFVGIVFLFWIFCLAVGFFAGTNSLIFTSIEFYWHFSEAYIGAYLFGGAFGLLYNDLTFLHTWFLRRDQRRILFAYDLNQSIQIIKSPILSEVPHKPPFGQKGADDWVYNYDVPNTYSSSSSGGKPLTIAFVANPVFRDLQRIRGTDGVVQGYGDYTYSRDPILERRDLFVTAVENALASLQSNEVVGRPEIWSRIRVVTIFEPTFGSDKYLAADSSMSDNSSRYGMAQSYLAGFREVDPNFGRAAGGTIAFDGEVAENLLDPSHSMIQAYRNMLVYFAGPTGQSLSLPGSLRVDNLFEQTDVIYAISAVENYDRPVAHPANWDEAIFSAVAPASGECVNFSDRQKDEQVAARYSKDGFVFESVNGQTQQIYLASGPNELGLRLSVDGIRINLPQSASLVNLRLVSYHSSSPIKVTALNAAGSAVDRANVPATPQDAVYRFSLRGQGISDLEITGGGGDGVLLGICIPCVTLNPNDGPIIRITDNPLRPNALEWCIQHEYYYTRPGRIAVNVYAADQRTYIHEFAHAISSANVAPVTDEYYDRQDLPVDYPRPVNAAPVINRQDRQQALQAVPADFVDYNGTRYFSDREHPSARENWLGYFPEKHDVDSHCLMDRDYSRNRFDTLLSDFLYDLLMAKLNRP